MVPEGVEPSTFALLARHSNRLSYGTVMELPSRIFDTMSWAGFMACQEAVRG
ncbi:hypothetical protein ASPVEDRAFT_42344 [Aspergillus versicolor CBS 583.65]|uniref:Uncharacterized protein n=1 Tax=Aspergillus versicolor CBS 583.65 TaxID=1036611 RepID=A0A1L9PMT3_ASPVE|nr:uncharacterized protein ASPVEDRAFT_42344 [Aspergillus versicolor CBS 583.65]OJJ02828.1 hypothetical protein ASPVEDRAFT_42344 [Aspergillus versicolor CBS 583.65]